MSNSLELTGMIASELSHRAAKEYGNTFLRRRLTDGGRYISALSLLSAGDRRLTLRVLFCAPSGKLQSKYELVASDALRALEKPCIFDRIAKRFGSKYIIVSLSAPEPVGIKRAFEYAEKLYGGLTHAVLYDFLLIENDMTVSIVRGARGETNFK